MADNRSSTAPVQVALWGPPSAGKTMYLAQLFLRADQTKSRFTVYPTPEVQTLIETNRARIDNENRFLPATQPGTGPRVLYRFRTEGGREVRLAIDDRAGGEWMRFEGDIQKIYLDAQGLMLLFDSQVKPKDLETDLLQTVVRMHVAGGSRDDPRPVALCLSKADMLIRTPADKTRALTDPDGFMRAWLDRTLSRGFLQGIRKYFPNIKMFPISSIGVRFKYGQRRPVVFFDERCQPRLWHGRELEPLNLMAPLEWLFDELEVC